MTTLDALLSLLRADRANVVDHPAVTVAVPLACMTNWNLPVYATAVAVLSGLAIGQTTTSPATVINISGRVLDQLGTPIPKATVKLKAVGIDEIPGVGHTDHNGKFGLKAAPEKSYELSVETAGFKRTIKTVDVGSVKNFETGDIVMPVGEVSIIDVITADVIPTLIVQGISGTTVTLSASDIARLPQQTVEAIDHGIPVTFHGVLLTDVLAKVTTPTGEAFSKTVASHYLIVEAQDGYKALFSWAEIDPTFTDRKLYVALKRDRVPLSSEDGRSS